MRTKRTLNALRNHFHFTSSNENGNKRNLVSFCFTFNEYKNEMKSAHNPFSWLWRVWKRHQTKLRIILWLFRECDNNPNDALNLLSCFCKIEKDKLCLCVLFHGLASTRKNKSLLDASFSLFNEHDKEQKFAQKHPFSWFSEHDK